MVKINPEIIRRFKIVLSFLMMLTGIISGFLPILQGWVLILGGIILFRTTQPDDWRLPRWIDKRLPKKVKDIIYKDIILLKKDKQSKSKKSK